MKTVGDFKKAGLVFVVGDEIYTGERIGYWSAADDEYFKDHSHEYTAMTPKSFTWRTNVGFTPNFNGVVEFELCDGDKFTAHISALYFAAKVGGNLLITKWRPHLDAAKTETPAIKPVFTQAMADAGEFPPVGSDFSPLHNGKDIHTCLGFTSEGKVIGEPIGAGLIALFFISEIKPIDTKTDKEKAIDQMFEDAEVQGSKGAFERLYAKGYRKQ